MKRGIMFKDIDQKLACQYRIYIDPGTDIFIQTDFPLDHDKSSRLDFTHVKTCFDQFIHCFVGKAFLDLLAGIKRNDRRHDLLLSQLFHNLAELRLEYDNDCRYQSSCQLRNDPQDRIHLEDISDHKKSANDQKTLEQGISTGKFNPYHKLIYKKCDQYDLYDINDIHGRQIDI